MANLGKKERAAKRKKAIIDANLKAPMPEQQKGERVQQWKGQSTDCVARVKGVSHNAVFVAPRGFKTPTDTVTKAYLNRLGLGERTNPRPTPEKRLPKRWGKR